jgi:hypothetical protein
MNIDDLLTKYLEGETTAAEEKHLRAFFASGREHPQSGIYRPIFACFDREIRETQQAGKAKSLPAGRKLRCLIAGIAATILLAITLKQGFFLPAEPDPCLCAANYAVINGRCYTDAQQARSLALQALREVAGPDDIPLPGINLFNE